MGRDDWSFGAPSPPPYAGATPYAADRAPYAGVASSTAWRSASSARARR